MTELSNMNRLGLGVQCIWY